MTVRSYDQYCPIAKALDVVGDRWTLLILRDLTMMGPRRYADLRDSLDGIPPTLLSERLKALQAEGLVEQRELPAPSARSTYALTPRGREVAPVLSALARFGTPLLEAPADGSRLTPRASVNAMVLAWLDPMAVDRPGDVYELVVDGELFRVSPRGRRDGEPVLRLSLTASALFGLRRSGRSLREAIDADEVVVEFGSRAASDRFAKAYSLAKSNAAASATSSVT